MKSSLQKKSAYSGGGISRWLSALPVLFLMLTWGSVEARTITGKPHIVDGDTIKISGKTIRLQGIDAPEMKQQCIDAEGKSYSCGLVSTNALRTKIGGNSTTCRGDTRDRYGRLIGICYLGRFGLTSIRSGCHVQQKFLGVCYLTELDLNGWMVKNGYALAYRRYSEMYVDAELTAGRAGRGVWVGEFIWPWKWRKGERLNSLGR